MAGGDRDGRRGRRRSKMRLSRLYSFTCARRPSAVDDDDEDRSRIGGPGFSRVVHAATASAAAAMGYQPNSISTTKYNAATFVPKSLFEQFRRVANIYFLITGCLAYYNGLAPYSSSSAVAPLIIVIVATMIKEAIEDWRRKQQRSSKEESSSQLLS